MSDIIIIIFLILLNGIFSMSEIALISARKSRLTSDARRGSKAAATALKLADDPDRFLSTIQIGITLIGILTGLYSGATLADEVGTYLRQWGLSPSLAHNIGQILIVVVVTYLSIVVGELVPKRIGLSAANIMAKIVSRPMHLLSIIAMPAVWLLSKSTSIFIRLLGLKNDTNTVTEDEIKSLIQDGTDAGEVRKVEQDIMERTLMLGDLRISSIMTPKVDIASLWLDMDATDIKQRLSENLHNSYPVFCDRTQAAVCGVVSLKQLILTLDSPDFQLSHVIREPVYFPESMSVYDALDQLKNKNVHFALVSDEFGDVAGIITPSDILDGLVGEFSAPALTPPIASTGHDGVWSIDAQISFYDFLHHFDREELYHPASYATLGGFILEELRHIPCVGECYRWQGITFEITAMDGAKISRIQISLPTECDENGI